MANRGGNIGRGGRGAALLQLINQPVRSPGDAAAGSSQQPPGAFGTVQQSSEPAPPGQVHSAASATVPPPAGQAAAGPPAATPSTQGQVESAGQPSAAMGRGAMLQKLYDSQLAQQQQQQQPPSVSSVPSEASLESG